jgi:hypothetical protein
VEGHVLGPHVLAPPSGHRAVLAHLGLCLLRCAPLWLLRQLACFYTIDVHLVCELLRSGVIAGTQSGMQRQLRWQCDAEVLLQATSCSRGP